ncbi:MAG TPA: restriction endonuclease subunit S, partial [Kiritimatiellia bacterium]|nr:restriction endonuclease subunit S [Kiritimatiellia bacterium]
ACEGKLVPTEAELQKSKGGSRKDFESGPELLTRILAERRKNWAGKGKYKEPVAPDTANLPLLPEGWVWASVAQLGSPELNSITDGPFGSNLKTKHYTESGPRVIRLQNIGDGIFVDVYAHISKEHFNSLQKHRIHTGDIVIAGLGENPPRCCIIPEFVGPAIVKADCIRFKPHSCVLTKFVNCALNSDPVRRRTKNIVHGVGRPRLNLGEIKSIVIPLPPLAEQTRIVAEVERRLSVVDEMESVVSANLQRSQRLRQAILQKAFAGELIAKEVYAKPDNIIALPKSSVRPQDRHFARALLSAEIVHHLHNEPSFGRVKHQKIFYLCEHIAQIKEIEGQYHREVAGPLDNKLIYTNVAELKRQKWYREVNRDAFGHAYQPMAKAGTHRKYTESYWPDKLPVIERIITMMRSWKTDRCEIFCTVYAAWNDLILWNKEPTEAAILNEILNRWHDSKRRFPEDRWLKAIGWMKGKGFVPTGFGKPTQVLGSNRNNS